MHLDAHVEELGLSAALAIVSAAGPDALDILDLDHVPLLPPSDGSAHDVLRQGFLDALDASGLLDTREHFVFAGPDLLLTEALAQRRPHARVSIALAKNITDEIAQRIERNAPPGLDLATVPVPHLAQPLDLASTAILAVGFAAGSGYALIHHTTAEVLRAYRPSFYGDIALLSPIDVTLHHRSSAWTPLDIGRHFPAGHFAPRTS
ncbi:MAG: hypothetical protein CMM84_18740 [Rhodothermaceae bacterium]|mgnify:CR=1 FL=1|nr:hypothetical protein [Rhodothermaceae bacterium]MAQ95549.1 hypothetical protein [Rhodothermaceae bacterium]MBC13337.1 hypothetical protein [Rhodothermaceae bacterium]MBC15065.1 hypothetical protein [Rhodothermaceae bacterium]MBC15402.1 hypothetical protein [Rhodothermaceae bacterium]|tara:strand:- start:1085 stop:1702 length:618 start_codon:yes stop_codon:yes gene_type:complete